jgi:hypothetical protein
VAEAPLPASGAPPGPSWTYDPGPVDRSLRRILRRRPAEAPPAPAPVATPGPPAIAPERAAVSRPAVLDRAEALVAADDAAGAVDLLAAANRDAPDPAVEIRLVELRREAARGRRTGEGRTPWPPGYADPFPAVEGALPEIGRDGFATDVVGGAVAHHGAVVVRGLFSPDQVDRCVAAIDRAHEVREAVAEGRVEPDASFSPLPGDEPLKTQVLRNMVGVQGGIWLADSPTATATALEALDEVGAVAMMTEHFGDRPFFSLQKSTLRRSPAEWRMVAWHQDGSFLDADVRTMNIWVALTPCGGDLPTPGLEVVPRRMAEILPVDGVMSPHSIDYDLVDEIAAETPTIIPEFAPGDALVFDEHFLHRTHLPQEMTHPRYALECWFFAPSHHTTDYVPLLV